ncbi:unnamed protein product [Onchocerca ochengi]|uniref:DUF3480 domain-containing protein n=1 Tax=Onchocerca ochengi TaxID=42157 RepID=A0A182DZ78_ONCOC|nr:unnamed protein product [Onchocerca ochengi]
MTGAWAAIVVRIIAVLSRLKFMVHPAVPIFNVFGTLCYRNIYHWLRYKSTFKLRNAVNSAECIVDTRGSGFSLKTASVIGLLFGSFHLSLIRSSDEQQNPDIVYSKESNMGSTCQCFEAIGRFSEVPKNYKEDYVARVLKTTIERSLISLIKSATVKVRFALSDYNSDYQLLHGSDHTASPVEIIVGQRESERNIALDDLVKNADARKEVNKIFKVVSIGREEKEIQDHPLLTIAESTAHYLMRQMDYVEAWKN